MKTRMFLSALAVLSLAVGLASAQTGSGSDDTKGGAPGATEAKANAAAGAEAKTGVQSQGATPAGAEMKMKVDAKLEKEIRERGDKAPSSQRLEAEKKLLEAAGAVNDQAKEKGDADLAARIAKEFAMTSDDLVSRKIATGAALADEKNPYDVTWGELLIAQTLEVNAKTDITASQILDLRSRHLGWGQIVAGLGFQLGEAVSAVRSEAMVALGQVEADGAVAMIHGEGTRAGVDAAEGARSAVANGAAGADAKVEVTVPLAGGKPSDK